MLKSHFSEHCHFSQTEPFLICFTHQTMVQLFTACQILPWLMDDQIEILPH
ncbi:hypothetical protein THIOM_002315 [Candidatus Thiomargarita nelsonii]|uniref:Uncharacterized protein n=1 Tax=Candidatus Thiomargarita nelsonii TaxID=1003181 RepID=A0A176S1T8_9GAMM|nr:hypothetical protein THIOM_002315 [Candidatus Thiomargarita nelsonii]